MLLPVFLMQGFKTAKSEIFKPDYVSKPVIEEVKQKNWLLTYRTRTVKAWEFLACHSKFSLRRFFQSPILSWRQRGGGLRATRSRIVFSESYRLIFSLRWRSRQLFTVEKKVVDQSQTERKCKSLVFEEQIPWPFTILGLWPSMLSDFKSNNFCDVISYHEI